MNKYIYKKKKQKKSDQIVCTILSVYVCLVVTEFSHILCACKSDQFSSLANTKHQTTTYKVAYMVNYFFFFRLYTGTEALALALAKAKA